MDTRPETYQDLIDSVRRDLGVRLAIVGVGGGNEVMHARLETGQWLVVSEAEDFLSSIGDRLENDAQGTPLGWFAGVYLNDASGGVAHPASSVPAGCLAAVVREDALFHELGDVVSEVLAQFARSTA